MSESSCDTVPQTPPPTAPNTEPAPARTLITAVLGVVAAVGIIIVASWHRDGARITWLLLTGWLTFLYDVLPRLAVSIVGVVTALIALIIVLLGSHRLIVWVRNGPQEPELAGSLSHSRWRIRWTLSFIVLILLTCVAALAMTSLVHQSTWLLSEMRSGSAYKAR